MLCAKYLLSDPRPRVPFIKENGMQPTFAIFQVAMNLGGRILLILGGKKIIKSMHNSTKETVSVSLNLHVKGEPVLLHGHRPPSPRTRFVGWPSLYSIILHYESPAQSAHKNPRSQGRFHS